MSNVVLAVPQTGRILRKPQHTFNLRFRPYQIQPFLLAPVLPGETLKNAVLQARVVTDPVQNPLIGWWYETYFFYVKHRDMPDSAAWQAMVLTQGYDVSSKRATADLARNYVFNGGIDWAEQCLQAVVPHFFRDEGEPYAIPGTHNALNTPVAKMNSEGWWDSLTFDAAMPDGPTVPGGSTTETVDALMAQYELMRAYKLTNMSYEEFLKTYGVRPAMAEKPNKPELLRYIRDWTYPSNTINATNGTPTSALSWSIAERLDKDRFFSEPGFIFGCAVARPKLYLGKLKGAGVGMMDDAFSWLPALMREEVYTSLKKFAASAGPLAGFAGAGTDPYWVDVRDLFIYGDQFINYAPATTDGVAAAAMPFTDGQRKYAQWTDVTALFKLAANDKVKVDGICSLNILGTQIDQT